MNTNKKLTLKDAAKIVQLTPKTLKAYWSNDTEAPQIEIIGRSSFVKQIDLSEWLSKKAGQKAVKGDYVLLSGDLLEHYGKSYTWLWQVMNDAKSGIPKPFKIGRTNCWLASSIYGEV